MIRSFQISELDILMKIWLETNLSAHSFIDKSYWQNNYERVQEMLPKANLYVYEEDNKIQGFIGLSDNYIAGIFVYPSYQSKGIGKVLLDFVKEKQSFLTLQVYQKNYRALTFYKREGFVPVKEQLDQDTNELEIVMDWKNKAVSI